MGPQSRTRLSDQHTHTHTHARLMRKKVCFILDAGNWQGGGWTSVQRPTLSDCQSVGQSFHRLREGATCRNSTVSSEIGHWWSDEHHLDCSKYP